MTPKSYYLQRPVLFFFFVSFFYLICLFLHDFFFFKFTYSGTNDDGSVNVGSPPSEQYTVTNLVPDTFYKFYFDGISSCRRSLSQIIEAETSASGKLGAVSYFYNFPFLQRQRKKFIATLLTSSGNRCDFNLDFDFQG